jgi:hypothetical protein
LYYARVRVARDVVVPLLTIRRSYNGMRWLKKKSM